MNVSGSKNYTPLGYEALVPTSAKSPTPPAGAKYALITVEVQACRMRDDGAAATTLLGIQLKVTDPPLWYAGNLGSLSFFEDAGGSLVKILYYS
jgi:hypothetical protein